MSSKSEETKFLSQNEKFCFEKSAPGSHALSTPETRREFDKQAVAEKRKLFKFVCYLTGLFVISRRLFAETCCQADVQWARGEGCRSISVVGTASHRDLDMENTNLQDITMHVCTNSWTTDRPFV